mmetsp:Transcript_13705/g.25726  ORF Transcript_13705/g.25726 Transcript_13705/m.25726 type:complete len:132 (+) Transcript_13705:42-437(+)
MCKDLSPDEFYRGETTFELRQLMRALLCLHFCALVLVLNAITHYHNTHKHQCERLGNARRRQARVNNLIACVLHSTDSHRTCTEKHPQEGSRVPNSHGGTNTGLLSYPQGQQLLQTEIGHGEKGRIHNIYV